MPKGNILVYRLGSLGDTVIALPAFHAVRRAFPGSRITLLTNKPVSAKAPAAEEVLGRGHFFDRVLDYPVGTRNPVVLAGLVLRLWRLQVRTAVNLAAFRSDAATARDRNFFRLAGVRRFIGFDLEPRDKRPAPDPATGETEWEAARIARRMSEMGPVDLDDPQNWDLRLAPAEISSGESLLGNLPADRPVMAFGAGTKVQAKDWGIEKWERLSAELAGLLPNWRAVFLGSAQESSGASRCASAWGVRAVNLCGKASPREGAAVLKRCRLFLGHDSGPMHLAACVGVPCVAVFSARNTPRQWFPRGKGHKIVWHRTDCAGCGLEICVQHGKKCMASIPVGEVLSAALDLISNPPKPS